MVNKEHNYVIIELSESPQKTHYLRSKEKLKATLSLITGCSSGEARYDVKLLEKRDGHVFINHNNKVYELYDMDLTSFNNMRVKNRLSEVVNTKSIIRSFRVKYSNSPIAYDTAVYLKQDRKMSEKLAKDFENFLENWAKNNLTDKIESGIIGGVKEEKSSNEIIE